MTTKISELPTGQKVGNVLNETLNVGGAATAATTPTVTIPRESAATNAVHPGLRLRHTTSGTPAAGIGVSMEFEVETSANNNEVLGSVSVDAIDVTSSSEDGRVTLSAMYNGSMTNAEVLELSHLNSATTARIVSKAGLAPRLLISETSGGSGAIVLGTTATGTSGSVAIVTTKGTLLKNDLQYGWTSSSSFTGVDQNSANDTGIARHSAGVAKVTDGSTGYGKLIVGTDAATTNTAETVLTLERSSTGTPATGIGVAQAFNVETSSGNVETGAVIEAVATDVTSTSEDFDLVFKTMAGGAAASERARVNSVGQVISGSNGSSTAPAFRGTVTGSGLYFPSSGQQTALSANGTEGLLMRASDVHTSLPLSYRRAVGAKTSNDTVGNYTAANGSDIWTNRGATGTVTLTLTLSAGQANTFIRVATQALRIEPSAGKAFRRANGTLEAVDKYLELGSDGALLEVLYDGTEWLCLQERGTITVEP